MRRCGARVLRFLAVLSVTILCSSCAEQGPLVGGAGTAQPVPLEGRSPGAVENPVGKSKKADQILAVRVEESVEATLVRITGNASLHDYEFRREGESRFTLALSGINPGGGLKTLPVSSENVTVAEGGSAVPGRVQLVGSLCKPLDYYVLDTADNELLLTLYLVKDSRMPAGSQPPSVSSASGSTGAAESRTSPRAVTTGAAPRAGVASLEQNRPVRVPQIAPEPMLPKASAQGSRTASEAVRKQYTGKPISLDLLDADLKNVLRLLSDITGTNMVLEPDVGGRVTIKVEKVPWDQVLDMVLAMNDLGKEEVGNVIRIARRAKLKQEWSQQVEQIRAKQELLEVARDVGTITTAYLTINYAQPVEIAGKISEIKSDRGKISVDERSSLVIYSDYPNRIDAARNLLSRLDRATAQVMIEARIVTATRNATTTLGTDWNIAFQKNDLTTLSNSPASGTRTFQINQIPASSLFGFTIASLWGSTLASIDFKLSALETASEAKLVAAPKVLTINNVKAVISQGTQIPYLVRSDYGSSSTQFKDAVVELQVTPHITPDQKVRLEINAKQDEPGTTTYTVGDSSVPGIDTRKISTELLVDDGQVIVIGGVMRDRRTEGDKGTPGFKKIPLLGWLFKTETLTNDQTELLIFISPQIVDPSGVRPRS